MLLPAGLNGQVQPKMCCCCPRAGHASVRIRLGQFASPAALAPRFPPDRIALGLTPAPHHRHTCEGRGATRGRLAGALLPLVRAVCQGSAAATQQKRKGGGRSTKQQQQAEGRVSRSIHRGMCFPCSRAGGDSKAGLPVWPRRDPGHPPQSQYRSQERTLDLSQQQAPNPPCSTSYSTPGARAAGSMPCNDEGGECNCGGCVCMCSRMDRCRLRCWAAEWCGSVSLTAGPLSDPPALLLPCTHSAQRGAPPRGPAPHQRGQQLQQQPQQPCADEGR